MLTSTPVIAVVGATASGKSALAMALAQRFHGEIVNCDSLQLVRGFDIGTAKPSVTDLQTIPHHMFDITDAHDLLDAASYVQHARLVIEDIVARGKKAIVCGGTGLYFRALRWGLLQTPPSDPALRARLEHNEREEPGYALRELAQRDPEGAARIDTHNKVRVIRALELCLLTGQPASHVQQSHGFDVEHIPMQAWWLHRPREYLDQIIVQRTQAMLEAGFVDEVRGLLEAGVDPQCRPMQSVGYAEVVRMLHGELAPETLERAIVLRTRQYARKQETWFKKEKQMNLLDAQERDVHDLAQEVLSLLESSTHDPEA